MREDLSDVRWLQDQYDAAASQVPDCEGWQPDPMHQYDGTEDPTTYTGEH